MIKNLYDIKSPQIVETKNGKLRGFKWRDTYHFLGVPYGHAKRWQAPEPVAPWKGIKNCMEYGNIVPRFSGYKLLDDNFIPRPYHNMDEDCLNINIYTTSVDPEAKKPVMFYCHGGGFADGSAHAMYSYDGEANAVAGDVVMIFINHRLNIFGFLDCEKYGEQYKNSGNAGLQDIVLALQWVQENVAAFGGDPDNVTIYGQSGGGGKVTALMQTPAADGLYHKVICQSGVMERENAAHPDISFSEALIEAMMARLGTKDFQALADLDSDSLMELASAAEPDIAKYGYSLRNWGPVKNDWYLGSAYEIGFTEYAKKIPMIIGTVITEFKRSYQMSGKDALSEEEREAVVAKHLDGKDPAPLIAAWKKVWPDKNVVECLAPQGFRTSALHYADIRAEQCEAPTWNYLFSYSFDWDGGNTAWHSSELPFTFHNIDMYPHFNKGEVTDRLQEQLSRSWTTFGHTSDPNNDSLPEAWRPYTKEDHATMIFDEKTRIGVDFDKEYLDAQAGYGFGLM